jgi:hypothetical protein
VGCNNLENEWDKCIRLRGGWHSCECQPPHNPVRTTAERQTDFLERKIQMTPETTNNPQQFLQDDFGFEVLIDMGGTFYEKQISENTWQVLSGGGDEAIDYQKVVGVEAHSVLLETHDDCGRTILSRRLSEELEIHDDDMTTIAMVKTFLMRFVEEGI